MTIDSRNLQVLANFCGAAADAMAFTLMRTAHSSFVKETEDFSCQLVTRDGLAFVSPTKFGAPWYSGIDYSPLLDMFETYEDGDICITNDPYNGFVATHTPDMHIWKPVFHSGRIACFVVGHIHNTDVGGAVPASLSRALYEIEQEGVRIPPVKLMEKGRLNTFAVDVLRANVRLPGQNWGDLNAQISAVNIGERKLQDIITRFGFDDFIDGLTQILAYSEAQARAVIRKIPDGEYFFADYADEDGDGGPPCRIALTLTVRGDEVILDYTGSDPQLHSSLNMPTGGRERHPLVMVGLTYVLKTLDPKLILNAGTLRPARAILPEGSVVNCQRPAAVGMRSLTCAITQQATLGAFAQALPTQIPATAPGGNAIMNVKTVDRAGRPIMASIGPVGGGGGATPYGDGSAGAGGFSGFLRNTPIEITEAEVPILFHQYGLACNSGAAGRYRGGLSAVMEFEVFAPETMVTARNRNRSVMGSWGAQGGSPGQVSSFLKNPGRPGEVSLGNVDVVRCDPGDVIRVVGPGAGGYGDAFQRPTHEVLRDIRRGAVSIEAARRDYGVVCDGVSVDEARTRELRQARTSVTKESITYCPVRRAYESTWTRERYELLTNFLAKLPVGWRLFMKHRVFEAVATLPIDSATGVPAQMRAIFDQLQQRYEL